MQPKRISVRILGESILQFFSLSTLQPDYSSLSDLAALFYIIHSDHSLSFCLETGWWLFCLIIISTYTANLAALFSFLHILPVQPLDGGCSV